MLEIRKAGLLDVSTILLLLREMHGEPTVKLDEANWIKMAHVVVDLVGKSLVLVAVTEEDGIIGSIAGSVMTEWYSEIPKLADPWFYVRKEKRNSAAGFKLMKAYKKMAKELGISVKVGHVLGDDIERMDKFYEKLGFERTGTLYREAT